MTKISYTLRADRGLSFPRNDPIEPRAKKARRALEMFSSTDLEGFRSCCHHTPRHLACDVHGHLLGLASECRR